MIADTMTHDESAAARCWRLAVGLREDDLEALCDLPAGSVAAWEDQRAPVAEGVIPVLAQVAAAAAAETARMIERAATTGRIETFLDDEMTQSATGDRIAQAVVHRVCAGRAAAAVPEAQVWLLTEDGEDRPGWFAAVSIGHGLGLGHVRKWFDVPRRAAQYWLTGVREAPPGVVEEMSRIIELSREHIDELMVSAAAESVVWVCATEDQMEQWFPARDDLPLPTHQVCAARAAVASPPAQLVFIDAAGLPRGSEIYGDATRTLPGP